MPSGGDTVVRLRLVGVLPGRFTSHKQADEEIARIVTALEGSHGVRFGLEYSARPNPVRREKGVVDVSLTAEGGAEPESLTGDLLDLFEGPPRAWIFRSDDTPEPPSADRYVVELVRREERCPMPRGFPPAGVATDLSEPSSSQLWSMWRFDGTDQPETPMLHVLLRHQDPVTVRVELEPTVLGEEEGSTLEGLVESFGITEGAPGLVDSSASALRRLLLERPLYEMRVFIESVAPIPPSIVSSVGWAISAPPELNEPMTLLSGGYQVVDHGLVPGAVTPDPPGSMAPEALQRLRRLFGAWEAASAFRPPVRVEGVLPGVSDLVAPVLTSTPGDLPETGVRLGSVAGSPNQEVLLAEEDRLRHLYVVGQTGTGKSTLLSHMAIADMEAGRGIAVVDPHGDLVELLLRAVPDDRVDDVILVDPSDDERVVGVNLLEAESELERQFLISELAEMMYSLFDPGREGIVGPRFESWMRNAALLLISSDVPASFLDIPNLFTDRRLQRKLAEDVDDAILREFWHGEIAKTTDYHVSEILGWFRSKFEVFRTSSPVRRVVGQARSTISFTDIINTRKILLVNLSKGKLGHYDSRLIGYVVMTKLWGAALQRGAIPYEDRDPFFMYVDEFHSVSTSALPDMLSEARKFGIGVTLANQFFDQIDESLRGSLMGNVGSRIAFRLGPSDSHGLTPWLGDRVDPASMRRLPAFSAVAALSDRGTPLQPVSLRTDGPARLDPKGGERVKKVALDRWARPVAEIDHDFQHRWDWVQADESPRPRSGTRPRLSGDKDVSEARSRVMGRSFLDELLDKHASSEDQNEGTPGEEE